MQQTAPQMAVAYPANLDTSRRDTKNKNISQSQGHNDRAPPKGSMDILTSFVSLQDRDLSIYVSRGSTHRHGSPTPAPELFYTLKKYPQTVKQKRQRIQKAVAIFPSLIHAIVSSFSLFVTGNSSIISFHPSSIALAKTRQDQRKRTIQEEKDHDLPDTSPLHS